jgi:hypothetical protein
MGSVLEQGTIERAVPRDDPFGSELLHGAGSAGAPELLPQPCIGE